MANALHGIDTSSDEGGLHAEVARQCTLKRLLELLLHSDSLFILLAMVLGAAIRLDFMQAAHFVIDADEAIIGLMGKHILEGREIPVFYYGQHYMGSLEAILASVSFRFLGVNSFALQLVPFLFSIALIPLVYLLGRECGGSLVGRVAAILMAIPPTGLVVWSTKARGGFIEILFIGVVALCIFARWMRLAAEGGGWLHGKGSSLRYPIGVGFVLGVGWWVNNQILYFIGPIGLFAALGIGRALLRESRLSGFSRAAIVVLSGSVAFLVGSSPYWIYNISRGFPSLGMFGFAGKTEMLSHVVGLFSTAVPILLGAKQFWSATSIFPYAPLIYGVVYGVIALTVVTYRRHGLWALVRGRVSAGAVPELLLLFILFSFTVFSASTFGWLVQAPRYLLPVYGAVFVLCGVALRLVAQRSPRVAGVCVGVLVAMNLASSYLGGRAVPGEPVVFNGERVSRDHAELIATLRSLGISHVRTNYWIGYRLAFETQEGITFSMFEEPHQIRIPEYEAKVPVTEIEGIPLVLVPSEAELVRGGLEALSFSFREVKLQGYVIFYDIKPAYPEVVPVSTSLIENLQASGKLDPRTAVDAELGTRWGTAEHQTPGQFLRVAFREPIPLRGIEYLMEEWSHDYPRGLEVDLELADGSTDVVLDPVHFRGVQYFLHDEATWHVFFPATSLDKTVRAVTLRQTGSHPVLDWSVAEVRFFMDRNGAIASRAGGARER